MGLRRLRYVERASGDRDVALGARRPSDELLVCLSVILIYFGIFTMGGTTWEMRVVGLLFFLWGVSKIHSVRLPSGLPPGSHKRRASCGSSEGNDR